EFIFKRTHWTHSWGKIQIYVNLVLVTNRQKIKSKENNPRWIWNSLLGIIDDIPVAVKMLLQSSAQGYQKFLAEHRCRRRHKQRRLPQGLASCLPASTRFWIWRFIADESLAIAASRLASCPPASSRFWIWRFIADESLAIAASIQAITLSTCIVAQNNALFALLVSNNFAQIKSNVFKRYSRDNVYSLVYF
ncbi:hypothetical protein S245_049144, partial [Arachis hypogaea]